MLGKRLSRREFLKTAGLVSAGVTLAACAPSPAPTPTKAPPAAQPTPTPVPRKPVEVVHWSWLSASDAEIWKQMIDNFNAANADMQIRMETLPYEEYDTKVLASVSAGQAPDFGWAAPAGGLEADWIAKGVIVPLDDLVSAVGLDLNDFTDTALKVARYPTFGNKLYEIPMDVMTMAVELNVDHAKEAGLDITKPPQTGDELIEWAKAMTKHEGDKVVRSGFLMGPSIQQCVVWGIVSAQMGFQRASDDLKTACVNPEAGKQAMQWILDLFDRHKVSTREVTDRYKAFGTAEGSMFLTGPWTISGYMKQGLNFISFHVPKIGQEQKTYLEMGTLEVYKQTDASRNQATVKAIKWLSDNSLLWTTKGRGAAVRKSILALPEYKTEGLPWEMRGAFVDEKALSMATVPIGLQVTVGADDFVIYSGDNFLATTLDRVWHGEKSIDEAMEALCQKWQEYLSKA